MAASPLSKAQKLFDRRRFPEVIQLLEPIIFTFRDSFQFYYLLGASCLFTGDTGGAQTYLRRARQIKPHDAKSMNALAAVHVRKGELHDAVELYLEVLDDEPRNRTAKKALNFLRKHGDPDTLAESVDGGSLRKVYPLPAPPWIAQAIACVIVVALVLGVFLGIPQSRSIFERKPRPARPEVAAVTIENEENLTELGGQYRYILTKKQVLDSFNQAKGYFQAFRDNRARVELNRILNSNASTIIKQKARILDDYVVSPSFENLKDVPAYEDVKADPYLYQDCAVSWKGRITNLTTKPSGITFDFLVGYDQQKVLEGIVPVSMGFAAVLDPSFPYEILGAVRYDGKNLSLSALSIHQLGK
jgi:tetratricopeptide (TPR) repeat protein